MNSKRLSPALIFIEFFLYAVAYNFYSSLSISIKQAGMFISIMQIGATFAILSIITIFSSRNIAFILKAGTLIIACGFLMLSLSSNVFLAGISFFLIGIGSFFSDTGSSGYLNEYYPNERNRFVPVLFFMYSLGAILVGYIALPFKAINWRAGYVFLFSVFFILWVLEIVTGKK